MEEKKELTLSQKICWAVGQGTGRQFITALVSTYILVFLTDTFGVAAGAAGIVVSGTAVLDAVTAPIIGSLADRNHSRWGTYRPFLLFIPAPLGAVAVLLFAAPDLPPTGKVAYIAILYICYCLLVTTIEVPYSAILPTMSRNAMERNDVISTSTFLSSIMILIVSSFTPNLVSLFGGDNTSKGYMTLMLIGAVLMCITSWLSFAKCREKYVVDRTGKESVWKNIIQLLKVKEIYPMLAFWCVGCILFQVIMASSVYYCMYYLMNPGLITTYMLVISISGMVGIMGIMPVLLRKIKGNLKKAVTMTQSISIVCYIILFFVGGKSLPALYILTFIACMFSTMTNAFRPMTVVGMTDYVRKKTGQQLNGTISAIGGFSYKCGTALSNGILAGVLAVTGYVAGAVGGQPQSVLIGINSVRFLVPLAASVLYIIFIQFYPGNPGKKVEESEN